LTDSGSPRFSPPDSRAALVCLVLIGVSLTAGMIADQFLLTAGALALIPLLILTVGSPVRVASLIFAVQILFTITQLCAAEFYLGFLTLRVDDLLSIWLFWLWLLSLPDGTARRGRRIGRSIGPGLWVGVFLALAGISAYTGLTKGNDPDFVGEQIKTYGAYLFYFPMLWVLSRENAWSILWKVLLASAAVSGLVIMIKGVTGSGEGVYYREETGLRIGTRQPNAIGAVMLLFLGRLWKDWRSRPPLLMTLPAVAMMGGALILSQTRGLWGGVLLAMASAWILNLFRKDPGVGLGKKLVVSLTVLAVMVVLVVSVVSTLGILSATDIARRTESESGNYLTDTSILSRIFSWIAVIEKLDGPHLLMGRGMGETITYFKPEFLEMRTMFFVDSSYFQTALIMGLAGVGALLMVWMTALVRAARLFLRTADSGRAGLSLGLFCAILMLLFASAFASPLTNYNYTILWVFLLALLQTEIRREGLTLLSGEV
jgi:hypothetical protein